MSRVTEIRYVGYGVEDLVAERKFYADDWGLIEVAADEETAWFKTHGHDEHHVVRDHRFHPGTQHLHRHVLATIPGTVHLPQRSRGDRLPLDALHLLSFSPGSPWPIARADAGLR